MVVRVDIFDNLDMVENVNMVDNIDLMNMHKTFVYLWLLVGISG